ncbi:hypothetical protein pb186bvf_000764 [Paramecium bursaria]
MHKKIVILYDNKKSQNNLQKGFKQITIQRRNTMSFKNRAKMIKKQFSEISENQQINAQSLKISENNCCRLCIIRQNFRGQIERAFIFQKRKKVRCRKQSWIKSCQGLIGDDQENLENQLEDRKKNKLKNSEIEKLYQTSQKNTNKILNLLNNIFKYQMKCLIYHNFLLFHKFENGKNDFDSLNTIVLNLDNKFLNAKLLIIFDTNQISSQILYDQRVLIIVDDKYNIESQGKYESIEEIQTIQSNKAFNQSINIALITNILQHDITI